MECRIRSRAPGVLSALERKSPIEVGGAFEESFRARSNCQWVIKINRAHGCSVYGPTIQATLISRYQTILWSSITSWSGTAARLSGT